MESRLLIAYALIAAFVVVGGIAGAAYARRRVARKRRLRGIKSYNGSGRG